MVQTSRRTFLKTSVVATAGATMIAGCLGDDEDLTVTVPFGEGGGTDTFAREVIGAAGDFYDGSITFENEPGEGGLVGTQSVYNSEPDGSRVVVFNPPSTPTSWLIQQPDFEIGDMTGVSIMGFFGYMIYANSDYGVEDMDDLIERYEEGEFTQIAGQGQGTMVDVVARVLRDDVGLPWESYIDYEGGGDVTEAVMGDEVPVGIGTDTGAEAGVADGRLDPVVGLVSEGSGVFPDMTSFDEQGYGSPGDPVDILSQLQVSVWAPPDTDRDDIEQLAEAIEDATETDEVQSFAEDSGNVVSYGGPDDADDLLASVLETVPEVVDLDEIRADA